MGEIVLSFTQAAEKLGIPVEEVLDQVKSGALKAGRDVHGIVRVVLNDVPSLEPDRETG